MPATQHIQPKYRLILFYNIQFDKQDQYKRYMLNSFLPAIRKLGVYLHMVWHVAYGDYPMRRLDFVTESAEVLHQLFQSAEWEELESRLQQYIDDYERKVVDYRQGIQL